MSVLLSIRPKYVEAILAGEKKYEFRKSWPRRSGRNDKVFIYMTSPVCKIVGMFRTKSIVEDNPRNLWRRFGVSAGISSNAFFEYFGSRKVGYAIEISDLRVFGKPVEPRTQIPGFVAPQSFLYLDEAPFQILSIRPR
jgi:predicted transcriptional regulator